MFVRGHNWKKKGNLCWLINLEKPRSRKFAGRWYTWVSMLTKEIAGEVSRKTGVTRAEAVHEVQRLVHDILHNLRSGKSANLPGLGKLIVGGGGRIRFRKERA